jgi:cytochrome c peroxidase
MLYRCKLSISMRIFGLGLACVLFTVGCGSSSSEVPVAGAVPSGASPTASSALPNDSLTAATLPVETLRELGQLIFNDVSLSSSGKLACSTCHDPAFAHASNPALGATVSGGTDEKQPGLRNVPTLRYLRFLGPLNVNVAEGEVMSGFNWDGSANSFIEQAQRPFLSSHEMGNGSAEGFLEKLKKTSYFARFETYFGKVISTNAAKALEASAAAVGEFQSVDPSFAPFDSKFDAVQAGQATFNAQEARGFAWFVDPAKGNCAECHSPEPVSAFIPALFTDFGYDNLGVPRNMDISANKDPNRFDLGLCSNALSRITDLSSLCGAFKAPTLRNVSRTAPYFHNGKFSSLKEVVEFYVTRDLDPGRWYPTQAGVINQYNDVPAEHKDKINTSVAPYNRKPGDSPALTSAEIEDLLVFLKTLDDGWKPPLAAASAAGRTVGQGTNK